MKNKLTQLTGALALLALSTLNPQLSTAFAQATAFTYQGRLNDGANLANGTYDLRFAIYDALTMGTQQGTLFTNPTTAVSNGLFIVTLDFGNQFPGANRWLEIAVRTNGATSFFTLSPRQALTPAPYAITAGNVIAGGLTTGTYGSAVTFNNANNSFSGSFSGNGANVTNVNAATLGGLRSSNFWNTAGNSGTTPGANFLGTADNQPLNLRVNNTRAFHLEPTVNDVNHSNIVNVLGGSPANVISTGIYGATIAGGGAAYYFGFAPTNSVTADFGTVSGGFGNTSSGANAAVGGGYGNISSGLDAVIGGGYLNSSSGGAATIGGGYLNVSSSNSTTVAGGAYNVASGQESAIGGGQNNAVTGPWSTIAGGAFNSVSSAESVIGGGQNNTNSADYSVIAGGVFNQIQTSDPGSFGSFIGSGQNNAVQTNASGSFIGSGNYNIVQSNAQFSVIGGGRQNNVQNDSAYSVIGGGYFNGIQTNTAFSVIGGGSLNTIQSNANVAVISGGDGNTAGGFGATVPGGIGNSALGWDSFAAGTHAQATNDGAFVLSDLTGTNSFYSTTSNQFSARFSGGVRFVTGGAGMTLDGQPVLAGSNVNATTLGGLASSNFWKTTGNAGTTPGANFIGTTDGQPLLLHASFVGVGRSAPISAFEYFGVEAPVGAGTFGGMYVDTTAATGKPFYGYAQNGAPAAYHYVDGADGNKWKLSYGLTVTPAGNVGIGTTTPGNLLVVGSSGSPAYCNGTTWQNGSDRNSKEQFAAIKPAEVLEKVSALPITEWKYKVESDGTRHLGPVAQDFHAAFGLNGADDKHIATVDEGGVALAAIQGLNEKLNQKLAEKAAEIQQLKQSVAQLQTMVSQLAKNQSK